MLLAPVKDEVGIDSMLLGNPRDRCPWLHGLLDDLEFFLKASMAAWVCMVPMAGYYLWLEIVTSGYSLVHPSLWFNPAWDKDWGFGFVPGIAGIAVLFMGIAISIEAISSRTPEDRSRKGRAAEFFLGTVILVSLVAPFLLNWSIASLKELPMPNGGHAWWIL